MSVSTQEQQERIPIGQILLDDFYLLFLLGVVVPFVFYTVWGLVDIGSIPMAKPVAIAAQPIPPAPAGAVINNVSLTEFKINLAESTLPVNKPIRFNLINDGKIEHDFVIEKVGAVNQPLQADGKDARVVVATGSTGYLDWTFKEPGEYQAACHIPGHYEAGMVTKFTVK